ncbi:MAG: 3,4-dihydroxy-2-butanone-4-phosphate synthase [Alphaproteobacteria bacterium]
MPHSSPLSLIEEILQDAKDGKPFILVDDESRENEGDIIIPAEFATAEVINFMAKNARGLICLALTSNQTERLGLEMMTKKNSSPFETAFTISIEASKGVTTGISAFDRALTIKTAINLQAKASDIISPGHIFPLKAKDGGVLERAGHTEASVDISKLAGLNPSSVICEIMNEDGSMARLPELIEFAKKHHLKIASIADLISYRLKFDKLIEKSFEQTVEISLDNKKVEFKLISYQSKISNIEHIVLQKGDVKKNLLVRMHAFDYGRDVLGIAQENKTKQLEKSLKLINKAKSGLVVIINNISAEKISSSIRQQQTPKDHQEIRNYGIGAQILLDLGVKDLTLLTNSHNQIVALDGYGIKINKVLAVG